MRTWIEIGARTVVGSGRPTLTFSEPAEGAREHARDGRGPARSRGAWWSLLGPGAVRGFVGPAAAAACAGRPRRNLRTRSSFDCACGASSRSPSTSSRRDGRTGPVGRGSSSSGRWRIDSSDCSRAGPRPQDGAPLLAADGVDAVPAGSAGGHVADFARGVSAGPGGGRGLLGAGAVPGAPAAGVPRELRDGEAVRAAVAGDAAARGGDADASTSSTP